MMKHFLFLIAFTLASCRAFHTPSLSIAPRCDSCVWSPVLYPSTRRGATTSSTCAIPSRSSITTTQLGSTARINDDDNKSRSSAEMSSSAFNKQPSPLQLERSALLKYAIAIVTQCSLFYFFFTALDGLAAKLQPSFLPGGRVPFLFNFVLFYFVALKSRIFNPLSNKRPKVQTLEVSSSERRRLLPSWTPPGPVFPVAWLLMMGPLRAVASSLIYQVTGTYACLPIMSLVLHLSIGEVWNTINNVERRYGVSVAAVYLVWLSKAHAAFQFGRVSPTAGKLLGLTLIWLTIASTLITAIWKLNPDIKTGDPEPWYPVKGKASRPTEFAWFSKKEE